MIDEPMATASLIRALVKGGANIDHLTLGSITALTLCAIYGMVDNAKILLELGASIWGGQSDDADALKMAIEYNQLEIVALIEDHQLNQSAKQVIVDDASLSAIQPSNHTLVRSRL